MGHWRPQPIAGMEAEVFDPDRRHDAGYAVIYLHGVHLNRLSAQPAFTELFDRWGLTVVAPVTGRCWWVDRVCRDFHPHVTPERHVRDNVLAFLSERYDIRPPRIGLLGTSMGGQGALRMAYRYPDRFPVVAAIAPAIDYQLRFEEDEILQEMYSDPEAVRQDTATLHIHPLNWPRHQFFCCDPADLRWWDSADRLRMKLYSLGIPHECDLETSGGGHGFEYYNRMGERAVRFLVDRLDQERRRLH